MSDRQKRTYGVQKKIKRIFYRKQAVKEMEGERKEEKKEQGKLVSLSKETTFCYPVLLY